MILFKSGYKVRALGNDLQPERLREENHTWERYSDWDRKVIKLEKFKGNPEQYALMASGAPGSVDQTFKCPWKKIPRVYVSLMREKERLDNLGIRNDLPSMATMQYYFDIQKCGSAKDFFQEYLK